MKEALRERLPVPRGKKVIETVYVLPESYVMLSHLPLIFFWLANSSTRWRCSTPLGLVKPLKLKKFSTWAPT